MNWTECVDDVSSIAPTARQFAFACSPVKRWLLAIAADRCRSDRLLVAAVPLSGPLRAFDRLRALRRLVKVAGAEKRPSAEQRNGTDGILQQ